ncbi:unnamed protein product [Cunninghamella blakesleeana]
MAELIVYLEPAKETPLYQSISTFLNQSKETYYPSTATKYPPHTSITGFFHINNREWIPLIINKYDHYLKEAFKEGFFLNESNRPYINIEPLLVSRPYSSSSSSLSNYQKQNLLLPIQVSTSFHTLFSTCAHDINHTILTNHHHHQQQELQNEKIRIKRIDHISLFYLDEPNATEEEMEHGLTWPNTDINIKKMKEDIFNQLNALDLKNQKWDIVFYERIHKSITLGEPHQLNELARWLIY